MHTGVGVVTAAGGATVTATAAGGGSSGSLRGDYLVGRPALIFKA